MLLLQSFELHVRAGSCFTEVFFSLEKVAIFAFLTPMDFFRYFIFSQRHHKISGIVRKWWNSYWTVKVLHFENVEILNPIELESSDITIELKMRWKLSSVWLQIHKRLISGPNGVETNDKNWVQVHPWKFIPAWTITHFIVKAQLPLLPTKYFGTRTQSVD